jgi:lipopolysaccharide export LptBFGC system permease protein LptF
VTLQLYILRQLLVAVCFAAGGLGFIAVPAVAVNAVNTVGGVAMHALIGFLGLALIDLVPYLMPIGFLLAVVATYGRLAADNEWTAIAMAGIHPIRMLLPSFAIAVVLAGVTHWLATEVSPGLFLAKREYLRDSLVSSFRELNPGRTELPFNKFYLSAQFREGNTFRDVLIQLPSKADGGESQTERTVLADSATITFSDRHLDLTLANARTIDDQADVMVGRLTARIDLDQLFRTTPVDKSQWKFQTSEDLRRMMRRGTVPGKDLRKAAYELHRRDAIAPIYFLFVLLGASTGLILRRGTQLGALAISVGFAFAYYVLSMRLGKTLAEWGAVPPALAAWATNLIALVAGLVLCVKAFRR